VYDFGFNILGFDGVNGILCLLCTIHTMEYIIFVCTFKRNIMLLNPTTKKFKLIPSNPFDFGPNWSVLLDHRELGYDSVKNDYKAMFHGIVVEKLIPSPICVRISYKK
jgi:hypothetical protein